MVLNRMEIRRMEYGPNNGRLVGKIEFKTPTAEVSLILGEEMAQRILELCAAGVVDASKAIADNLCADVLVQAPLLAAA